MKIHLNYTAFALLSTLFLLACNVLEPAPEPLFYTVSFDLSGVVGTVPENQILKEGEMAQRPFVKIDDRGAQGKFAAIKWYESKDGSGAPFEFASTPINADTKLYAKWESDFWPVHFKLNYSGATPSLQYVGHGAAAEEPAEPTRQDFLFTGWYENGSATKFNFATPITGGITLYATWVKAKYSISFDLNGGQGRVAKMQNINYQNLAIEPVAPTRTGYSFFGWVKDKTGTTIFDFTSPITEDIALYAGWQAPYTFTLDGTEYTATIDGNTFLVNVGKTYKQINDQDVILSKVPAGVTTKPAVGGLIRLSKAKGMLEVSEAGVMQPYKLKVFVQPSTNAQLKAIVDAAIAKEGDNVDLNFTDTSKMRDMSDVFKKKKSFNGDISEWDTSKVTNMGRMFWVARSFNGDVSKWDTANVTNMERMFDNATVFNGDVSKWNTSKVTDMAGMFGLTPFDGDVSKWDTSKVTDMNGMFAYAVAFEGDISKWDTSKVTAMAGMFHGAVKFNGDISKWDTANVTIMGGMFHEATVFNGDISKWDTSKVIRMKAMFADAVAFEGDISKWNTANVISMPNMFEGALKFNGDISEWNTANVITMWDMFKDAAKFNQDISRWNTSKVTHMGGMFHGAVAFNGDISQWNTANVTKMYNMFEGAAEFNQDLSRWNTARVADMSRMFKNAVKFNQDISSWKIDNVEDRWGEMFDGATEMDNNPNKKPKF